MENPMKTNSLNFAICRQLIFAFTMTALLPGCAAIHEQHYFRSIDQNGKPVNYFRLTVTGNAQSANARYLSGYLDEKAVSTYFGTYGSGTEGNKEATGFREIDTKKAGTAFGGYKPSQIEKQRLESVFGKNTDGDKTLIMVLSSNPKGVFDQIGSLVDSQVFAESLAIAQNKDKLAELVKINAKSKNSAIKATALKEELNSLGKELKIASTVETYQEISLKIVSALASFLQDPVQIKTVDEARLAIAVIEAQWKANP
jgi:hypothetical protein